MTMSVLKSAVTGRYKSIGSPENADCIISQSFGASEHGPGYVNKLLANYVIERTNKELPLLVQGEIAEALAESESDHIPNLIIQGNPSTSTGGELDSWCMLEQAREYMDDNKLNSPILIAQSYHIGRLCLQAIKQGMEPVITDGLPDEFDPESTQFWTRDKKLWIPREVIGMTYLRCKNKL